VLKEKNRKQHEEEALIIAGCMLTVTEGKCEPTAPRVKRIAAQVDVKPFFYGCDVFSVGV